MAILSLFAKLGLDGRGFKAGIREAESHANKFGRDLKVNVKSAIAGAFSYAAMTGFIRGMGEAAKHITQVSDQLDMSRQDVQRLEMAADKAGIEFGQVERAILAIGEARKKAASDQGTRDSFSALGLTWETVNDASKRNVDILKEIFNQMGNGNAALGKRSAFDEIAGIRAEKLLALRTKLANLDERKIRSDAELNSVLALNREYKKLTSTAETAFERSAVGLMWGAQLIGRMFSGKTKLNPVASFRSLKSDIQGEADADKNQRAEMLKAQAEADLDEKNLQADMILRHQTKQAYDAEQKASQAILQLEIAKMSVGEKRAFVQKQINELLEDEANFAPGTVEHSDIATELANKRLELFNLDKQHTNIEPDSMQRIGNQLGNALRLNATGSYLQANNPSVIIARGQLTVLQEIKQGIDILGMNTKPKQNQAAF